MYISNCDMVLLNLRYIIIRITFYPYVGNIRTCDIQRIHKYNNIFSIIN